MRSLTKSWIFIMMLAVLNEGWMRGVVIIIGLSFYVWDLMFLPEEDGKAAFTRKAKGTEKLRAFGGVEK